MIRAFVNLSDLLLMLGRYQEAVATADEGIGVAEEAGLARTAGALLRSNKGEALLRSGRWTEALAAAAPEREAVGTFTASLLLLRIELNALAGRTDAATLICARCASTSAAPRRHSLRCRWRRWRASSRAPRAGWTTRGRASTGHWRGRRPARSRGTGGRCSRLASRIEAERAIRAFDEGGSVPEDGLERAAVLRAQAEDLVAASPAARGHRALVRAELARLARNGEVEAWGETVDACREMNEPFPLAYALLRQAEALAAAGSADAAGAAAGEAAELAGRMGAAPLLGELEALIRRARLRDLKQRHRPGADLRLIRARC